LLLFRGYEHINRVKIKTIGIGMNFLENFSVNELKLKLILMETFYDALTQRICYNSRRGFTSDAATDYLSG